MYYFDDSSMLNTEHCKGGIFICMHICTNNFITCEAKFTTTCNVETHMISNHTGFIYSCDMCYYPATDMGNLKRH